MNKPDVGDIVNVQGTVVKRYSNWYIVEFVDGNSVTAYDEDTELNDDAIGTYTAYAPY